MNIKNVYDGYLKMYELEENGVKYQYASRRAEDNSSNLADAVTCVIILKFPNGEEKLLLSSEYRYPLKTYMLSPTAGLVDPDDTDIIQTALREIMEEVGISDVDEIKILSPMLYSSPGMTDESNAVVLAKVNVDDSFKVNRNNITGSEMFNGSILVSKNMARKIISEGHYNYSPIPVWTMLALMYFVLGEL